MAADDPALEFTLDAYVAEVGGRLTGGLARAATRSKPGGPVGRVDDVVVSLGWETEGRGDTDRGQVAAMTVPVGPLGAAAATFSLRVPDDAPVSYDGSLIRIVYTVRAQTRVKLSRDLWEEVGVLVIPKGGTGRYDRAHPLDPR